MSKRGPDPKLLGIFVIGALALMIAALIAFGGGNWWRSKNQFVLYFDESIRGLSVGAPVMFRGVRIGSVGRIGIQWDGARKDIRVPVIIEIDTQQKDDFEAGMEGCADTEQCMAVLVEQGLRARLQIQSLITAQLMVEFDFFPETAAVYVGEGKSEIPELPTLPSGLREITQAVKRIPLDEVISRGMLVLEGVERLINSPHTMESLESFNRTLKQIGQLAIKLETEVDRLGRNLNEAALDLRKATAFLQASLPEIADDLQATLDGVQALTGDFHDGVAPLGEDLQRVLDQSRDTLAQVRDTFEDAGELIRDDSRFRLSLERTLTELNGTLRAVRGLAEYLQQYPDALLRGKREPKGSP